MSSVTRSHSPLPGVEVFKRWKTTTWLPEIELTSFRRRPRRFFIQQRNYSLRDISETSTKQPDTEAIWPIKFDEDRSAGTRTREPWKSDWTALPTLLFLLCKDMRCGWLKKFLKKFCNSYNQPIQNPNRQDWDWKKQVMITLEPGDVPCYMLLEQLQASHRKHIFSGVRVGIPSSGASENGPWGNLCGFLLVVGPPNSAISWLWRLWLGVWGMGYASFFFYGTRSWPFTVSLFLNVLSNIWTYKKHMLNSSTYMIYSIHI